MNLEDGFRAWFAHRRVNLLIGILFFALPLIFLSPGLSDFPYPSEQAKYSDFAITHYPNALYLQRSLIECRCIPLWSPTILSGYPFAANPLSGLWYPPVWLALLFPLPLGLNLMTALHLSLGGWGMYRLLRVEGLRIEAAVLGGLGLDRKSVV